jgi:hypothetical protein
MAHEAKLLFLIVDEEDPQCGIAHTDSMQLERRSARTEPGGPKEIIAVRQVLFYP